MVNATRCMDSGMWISSTIVILIKVVMFDGITIETYSMDFVAQMARFNMAVISGWRN